jgi:hypothetical protein
MERSDDAMLGLIRLLNYFFLLRKDRYCFLFPAHPIHSKFLSLIKQYFYSLYPKILIVNHYDLWVLRHKIGGAKVFVNNVQWSDQMMQCCMQYTYLDKYFVMSNLIGQYFVSICKLIRSREDDL